MDYGSAESSDWTESQLLQVAYGFRPDVAMPRFTTPCDAAEWAALLSFAKAQLGREIQIYGVLTEGPGTNTPGTAYFDMLQAVVKVTHQTASPGPRPLLTERRLSRDEAGDKSRERSGPDVRK